MSGLEVPETDKRSAQRLRVLKQGKILLSNNLSVRDCTVRDLSETGAKLLCPDPGAIPNEFRLVLIAERQMREPRRHNAPRAHADRTEAGRKRRNAGIGVGHQRQWLSLRQGRRERGEGRARRCDE